VNYINQEYIERYIRKLLPLPSPIMREMEEYALKHHVPIIHPEVAQLIRILIKSNSMRSILEVGTAIGYSAIQFAQAMGEDGHLTTIEREPEMVFLARDYIKRAGLEDRIDIIEGEAEEVLNSLNDSYDCIFLDAAKGHYMDFLQSSLRLLKDGGLLISDNVLFRGMVASDDLVKRRKITIVKRMRNYLKHISNHPQLTTSVIPIGDGLAISLVRSEDG